MMMLRYGPVSISTLPEKRMVPNKSEPFSYVSSVPKTYNLKMSYAILN
jgi:hypothetical protein